MAGCGCKPPWRQYRSIGRYPCLKAGSRRLTAHSRRRRQGWSKGVGSGGRVQRNNWRQDDVDGYDRQAVHDRETASVRSVQSGQIQQGCGRRGRADNRAIRSRLEGKPLQDMEQNELRNLLSTAGARCLHSQKSGGERILGVPTVSDRIAQMVVKQLIEPDLDPIFLPDSYGYRPRKSALDAVGVTRERCWKYDWVLEFDIRGLFNNINHELLLR